MKSADAGAGKMFELEMLEPRILLSGAPVEIMAAAGATVITLPQFEDVGGVHHRIDQDQKPSAAALTQSAPEQEDGIFAGMVSEDLPWSEVKPSVQNQNSVEHSAQNADPKTTESATHQNDSATR